jgi:hypothetical protein
LAHSAFARFHSFDVHFETSSITDDFDDEGVVVCTIATPDVTRARIAAATSADRTNDIVAGSLTLLSSTLTETARITAWKRSALEPCARHLH